MPLPLVAPLENIIRRCQQEGVPVIEWGGPHPVTGKTVKWREMTMPYSAAATPVGCLDHHTAPPVPYPIDKLAKACNYSIRHPDGAVVLMNAGIAYDSGNGDRKVLDAVMNDKPAPAPTDTYTSTGSPGGTNPGISGTKWYIDVEVMHLGDGSPLLAPMRRALIVANAALCEYMGWNPLFRVLGHREWTKRKIDPRWDGFANPMPSIRVDVAKQIAAWAQGDYEMYTQERVKGLANDPTRIDKAVDLNLIGPASAPPDGRKKYWRDKLVNPADPEWMNFFSALDFETAFRAGAGGGSATHPPLNVALNGVLDLSAETFTATGTAKP